jgi:DNA-binding Lrp family transcriptional regulator
VLTSLSKATAEDSNVTRVACTTGEYDVIIRIESADVPSLYSFISHAIHVIEGITSTITHIVAREISY